MHVHHHRIGRFAERTGGKFAFHRGKRIVLRLHEDTAQNIDDQNLRAVFRLIEPRAAARCAARQIGGAQQAVFIADESEDFALIQPMIAGGDAIHPDGIHLVGNLARDAKTARQIFAVQNYKIERQLIAQAGQFAAHNLAARTANHIANE